MKTMRCLTIALTCLTLGATAALAADQKEKPPKAVLEELLPKMEKDQGAQQQWQDLCFRAGVPGNGALREDACKLMAAKLGPDTPAPTRIWLLKQLERIGRQECLEAVSKAIEDPDPLVRDAAVRALANNPTPEAWSNTLKKLQTTNDSKLKVALLNALGYRAGSESICRAGAMLELKNPDPAVSAAAARVLGKIGTPGAAQDLAEARKNAQGEVRLRIDDAYLRCADNMLKAGKTQEAVAIYKELNQPQSSRPIRMAAFKGVLNTAGDQAVAMVLDALAGSDADARKVAVGHIGELGSDAVRTLGEQIQAALASGDETKQQRGVRAICNWPNASLADELLKLAQDAKDGDTRSRLLRSFARVIGAPSARPSDQKVPLLKRALELAERNEDRALVLDGAAAVRHVETLRLVVPYLDKPELSEAACKTVVELAHQRNLRDANQGDFNPALEKVIKTARDPKVVQRAKKYLAGVKP